jgi:Cd(II)/Pb(II)-responsive transcriptional regulator
MRIGELAKAAQTQVETVRYYEREGLLPLPPRTEGNYRQYDAVHLDRLAFIRHCRSLDMSLEEIRVLLALKDAPRSDCGEVNALLDEHIRHVTGRIQVLNALARDLKALRRLCQQPQEVSDCAILGELVRAAQAPDPDPGRALRRRVARTHG